MPRWLSVLAGMSAVGFVALVATPSHRALDSSEAGSFVWSVRLPSLRDLVVFTELGLNIWIAVPMGLFGVPLGRCVARFWPVVVAALVPLGCELLQWAVPSMARVGFQFSDLAANWTGVLCGALLGLLVLRFGPRRRAAPEIAPAR